ncbi:DUF2207 family protein [Propioniciclava soli]|uniref:DUF2207 domain-containing protein n=1 Tax=Propioniciclava soli TaxID=2775081 RepID=A0ABZ3C8L6_9ACTN
MRSLRPRRLVASLPRVTARLAATVLAATVLSVLAVAPPAQAATVVESYEVAATVEPDGALRVEATITPDAAPGDLVQRFATTLAVPDRRAYHFTVTDIAVTTADGADAGATVTQEAGATVVTIPNPTAPIRLGYTVRGAAFATQDTTTVSWRLLQGLNVGVTSFDATVAAPGPFVMVDCAAGPPANPGACGWYSGGTHDQQVPAFHDGPRGPGEVVQTVVRYPAAVVAPNEDLETLWSLDRAFSTRPLPLALAIGLGLLGFAALWLVHRHLGQDAGGADAAPRPVATFRPVGEGQSAFTVEEQIRPGHVGTVVDERVDPVDVAATVVDLAVRGALLIRELPRPTPFARTDWEFVPRGGVAELRPFEQRILAAVTPGGRVGLLSEVGHEVAGALGDVQSALYDDVVERGWFVQRPDETRTLWTTGSRIALVVAVLLTVVLVAFTSFGLLGLVLIALSLGAGILGQEMPARTAEGSSVLAGLGVLRGQLLTQPTHEMPHGHEVDELSEVLPFAMVLGGTERWLDGLVATDIDDATDEVDLAWYHGPQGWQLADLPDSLRNFVTTLEGTLVER